MVHVKMLNFRRWYLVALTICLMLALQSAPKAQEASGRIIGTVVDPKGAVIPGARVTVTNASQSRGHIGQGWQLRSALPSHWQLSGHR